MQPPGCRRPGQYRCRRLRRCASGGSDRAPAQYGARAAAGDRTLGRRPDSAAAGGGEKHSQAARRRLPDCLPWQCLKVDAPDDREDELSHIQIESVRRDFRANGTVVSALDDVTLEIKQMEFVAIVGPSGCGKTTLLRLVAGLDFPTSGRVSVGGIEVSGPGPDRAVVFQQFALFPWKTVAQNI